MTTYNQDDPDAPNWVEYDVPVTVQVSVRTMAPDATSAQAQAAKLDLASLSTFPVLSGPTAGTAVATGGV
jgi:hypothetical protein